MQQSSYTMTRFFKAAMSLFKILSSEELLLVKKHFDCGKRKFYFRLGKQNIYVQV